MRDSANGVRLLQRIFVVIPLCIFLAAQLATQSPQPERKVDGNVITSDHDPAVRIRLPNSADYTGADRWILYDIADCELHAFVDADAKKNVKGLYWIQFEGYVPTRPELNTTINSPRHANLGGKDFFLDTWVRTKNADVKPGGDVEHIQALIESKGYHLPDAMMYVRLVHLLDEQMRKELMIIYGEDISPSGLTALDLQPGGKAYDRWPAIGEEPDRKSREECRNRVEIVR